MSKVRKNLFLYPVSEMKRKVYKSENVDVLLDPERQKRSLFLFLI